MYKLNMSKKKYALCWIFSLFLGGCEVANLNEPFTYFSSNDFYTDCTGGFGSLGRCPDEEDMALIVDQDLFCEQSLSDVTCYSADPRPNRIMTQNAVSPLVGERARYVPLPIYIFQPAKDNKPRISLFGPMPVYKKIIPINSPPPSKP